MGRIGKIVLNEKPKEKKLSKAEIKAMEELQRKQAEDKGKTETPDQEQTEETKQKIPKKKATW